MAGWSRSATPGCSAFPPTPPPICLQHGFGHTAAILTALVFGMMSMAIFAVLSLRATGIGFIMITLAVGQIIWGLAYRWISITGGDNGINMHGRPEPFGISLTSPNAFYYADARRLSSSPSRP